MNRAHLLGTPGIDSPGNKVEYKVMLGSSSTAIVTGYVALQMLYDTKGISGRPGPEAEQVISEIKQLNNQHPGIVYVFYLFGGGIKSSVYIGKSEKDFAGRYPGSLPNSVGMQKIMDDYKAGRTRNDPVNLNVAIYQCGNLSLVEGLLFDRAHDQSPQITVVNKIDPN